MATALAPAPKLKNSAVVVPRAAALKPAARAPRGPAERQGKESSLHLWTATFSVRRFPLPWA